MSKALQILPQALAPGADLSAYISAIGNIPMLSVAEERRLAERYFQEQDVDAARQLVLAHLRFVVHIAKNYTGYGLPQADIIQEGNVGLMKAVKRFDPSVGVRLVSFAVHWIKAEIHEYVLRNWRIVKVATTKAQRKLFFNLRGAKKRLGWLSADEVQALADDLGVKPKDVREMEGRLAAYDSALDFPAEEERTKTTSQAMAPIYYLADDRDADPEHRCEADDWESSSQEQLRQALAVLDERSQDILNQRWLADKKATLHDLASKYNVSAERIRQLEKNALKKLKSIMTEQYFGNAGLPVCS